MEEGSLPAAAGLAALVRPPALWLWEGAAAAGGSVLGTSRGGRPSQPSEDGGRLGCPCEASLAEGIPGLPCHPHSLMRK